MKEVIWGLQMIIQSEFNPAWWLPNSHLQTIYPSFANRKSAEIDSMERLELLDGDFIDLAWVTQGLAVDAPLVILLHGLGGGLKSTYVAGLLSSFKSVGFRSVLMHFRGASGEPNRHPRAYHSGETGDLNELLECLNQREPLTRKAVVGISLGGNVLLKWLGEHGRQSFIQAAVAISVPFQLSMVAERINQGFSRVYQTHLLKKLRAVFLSKLETVNRQLPLSKEDLMSIKTIYDFDERITAPLHGFKNANAYYQEASALHYLSTIATPTLIIHALDDPFMMPQAVPGVDVLSKDIMLELSAKGGHVGFITGNQFPNPVYWIEQRIPTFLRDYLKDKV